MNTTYTVDENENSLFSDLSRLIFVSISMHCLIQKHCFLSFFLSFMDQLNILHFKDLRFNSGDDYKETCVFEVNLFESVFKNIHLYFRIFIE